MKKNIKISALFTCIATFIVTLLLSVSVLVTPAKAAAGEVFEMESGASVKLSSNGLRFMAKMDENYYNWIVGDDKIELWGYIAPVQEFDKVTEYKDLGVKAGGKLEESKLYLGEDGYYHTQLVLTNLDKYTYQDVAFSAIVFIVDNTSGTPQYTYADFAKDETGVSNLEAQTRTQYEVVNAAMLDDEKSYEERIMKAYGEWYGKEAHPIIVDDAEDVAALQNKATTVDLSGKSVFIKNGVSSSQGTVEGLGVSLVKDPGHIVKFMDGNKVIDKQFVADGESATAPADPTRDGYEFVEWIGSYNEITADTEIYAKWKASKGSAADIGNMTVYGVTLANGGAIRSDADVIGQKVILASGDLGDGAYYPGKTGEAPDPTDENNTADQAYLAYDGKYGFNDYFVADFTGKNMPTVAFFANNYNNSIFYGGGTKNGVVVATGLTWPDGRLFTEDTAYSTSVFNGKGLCMWGPHMIYNTGSNAAGNTNVLLHSSQSNVALGRANLVDGKKYRVIMGFQPGDDASNKAIKLVYTLYDLAADTIVESKAINTYNFFADNWANAGQTRDQFCLGSIVAYGYFGTTTVLDKVYDIYEDTTISAIAQEFGMPSGYNVSFDGDAVTLGAGNMVAGSNYVGPNANELINQAYFALNGEYGLSDYLALDFTGKNMPEIAFFAKNYNNSMYYQYGDKQGIVVASGITQYNGELKTDLLNGSKQISFSSVGMLNDDFGSRAFESVTDSKLARMNLVDGVQYTVIIGFKEGSVRPSGEVLPKGITLQWQLFNRETGELIENGSIGTWGYFTGTNADVNNMTLNDLSGSIVLYGKFGTACTIDKIHGVFEDSTIADIKNELAMDLKTVTFQNWDGTVLQEDKVSVGVVPTYGGETPYKAGDAFCSSYTFAGWDKQLAAVTGDVTYTAVFTGTAREDVTLSGGPTHTYGVEQSNNKIVLKKSGLGDGANYIKGQNNGGYVHQSYLAFDGNYALNDYIAFDFTGKNLPEIAFFANNYNDSMYAEGTSKTGIVVVTGVTTWDGQLSSGVNGNGTQINYGFPYMIQDASDGGFCQSALRSSALGRANLVDGTHYRVIMGFTGSGNAITLHWYLYNLDTAAVVEQSSMTTWNFFTGSEAKVGNMTINDLSGSIVLYGKFGVACMLDRIYGVFEDTTLDAVVNGLNGSDGFNVRFVNEDGSVLQEQEMTYGEMPYYLGESPIKASTEVYDFTFAGWDKTISLVTGDVIYTATYEATVKTGKSNKLTIYNGGNGVVLGNSNIGDSAHYSGSNNQSGVIGTVNQSYLAFDGNYSFNDYVVFDFTGKNMPAVAFFANNYNESMYYQNGDKYGLVVLTGLTTWQGALYTEYNDSKSVYDGKGLLVCGPLMLHNTLNSGKNGVLGFQAISSNSGNSSNVTLGRANLDDAKQYRVIMGMEAGNHAASVKIVYMLYCITDDTVVETFSAETYNFFTTGFAKDGQTRDQYCQGSIVLYGHFGTATTLDNVYGVYENTTLVAVAKEVIGGSDEGSGDTGSGDGSEETGVDMLGYDNYSDTFDFYAYSCYSDGTYEIDGQKYYIGKNLANLKQYAMYGEAGMTIYFPQNDMLIDGNAESLNNAKKLLDDLAKVGIYKTILQDNRILYLSMRETAIVGSGCQYATEADLDNYIYNCLKDYATYPGVYGVQLGDEPKYSMLSAYAAVYNSIRRVSEANGWDLHIQYNLNPLNVTETVYTNYYPASEGTYAWGNYRYSLGIRDRFTDTVTRYTQYINDFLDAMNPDSIMYDDYPLMENKSGGLEISDSYIPCLQIVAKAAADRGIKFYNVTQAYENNADGTTHRRQMTEAGAKWLNNILIGFGAKQIAYYTYYTRGESDSTGDESYVDGSSFVDYNGNPTELYYTMQEIMSDNQIFAQVVLQFNYKGSRVYGSTSANHLGEITVGSSFTKLTSFSVNTGSALVTELYDDENDNYMYMAMNVLDPDTSSSTAETVTMTFSGYTMALVYDGNGKFSTEALTNGVYTAKLNVGDAVYVIPYNN